MSILLHENTLQIAIYLWIITELFIDLKKNLNVFPNLVDVHILGNKQTISSSNKYKIQFKCKLHWHYYRWKAHFAICAQKRCNIMTMKTYRLCWQLVHLKSQTNHFWLRMVHKLKNWVNAFPVDVIIFHMKYRLGLIVFPLVPPAVCTVIQKKEAWDDQSPAFSTDTAPSFVNGMFVLIFLPLIFCIHLEYVSDAL